MHKVALWIQQVLVPGLGPAGILVVAFFDSSFVSIPEINDILVVSSSAAHPGLAWLYALSATAGSLLGCAVLWTLGRRGGEALVVKRFGKERMERTSGPPWAPATATRRWTC
jgi:membrane protein YqaA with SNARE-associated domain